MERRLFIKSSCKACLGVAIAGTALTLLEGCASLPLYKTKADNGVLSVPESQFAETKQLIVRNMQMDYDIFLVKKDDQNYTALYMQCSHRDQPLTATENGLHCTTHGSSFDLDGNVLKEPATAPLKQFKTETKNSLIHIYVTK